MPRPGRGCRPRRRSPAGCHRARGRPAARSGRRVPCRNRCAAGSPASARCRSARHGAAGVGRQEAAQAGLRCQNVGNAYVADIAFLVGVSGRHGPPARCGGPPHAGTDDEEEASVPAPWSLRYGCSWGCSFHGRDLHGHAVVDLLDLAAQRFRRGAGHPPPAAGASGHRPAGHRRTADRARREAAAFGHADHAQQRAFGRGASTRSSRVVHWGSPGGRGRGCFPASCCWRCSAGTSGHTLAPRIDGHVQQRRARLGQQRGQARPSTSSRASMRVAAMPNTCASATKSGLSDRSISL